jgi:hypothetical protein
LQADGQTTADWLQQQRHCLLSCSQSLAVTCHPCRQRGCPAPACHRRLSIVQISLPSRLLSSCGHGTGLRGGTQQVRGMETDQIKETGFVHLASLTTIARVRQTPKAVICQRALTRRSDRAHRAAASPASLCSRHKELEHVITPLKLCSNVAYTVLVLQTPALSAERSHLQLHTIQRDTSR